MQLQHLKDLAENADAQSKELIAVQEERIEELNKISDLMKSPNAEPLREMLKKDLEYYIRKAVADNDIETLANVRAYMRLIDKLNTKDALDSIGKWVEEKIKELE